MQTCVELLVPCSCLVNRVVMAALRGSAEMPPQCRLILRIDELDAETLVVVADDPRPQLAERNFGADFRPRHGPDRRPRDRYVEHLAVDGDAFRQLQMLPAAAYTSEARVTSVPAICSAAM